MSDIYAGFNDSSILLDTNGLKSDANLKEAILKTSHGRRAAPTGQSGPGAATKVGFFSRLKQAITGPKKSTPNVPSSNNTERLGTASRALQQQKSGSSVGQSGIDSSRPGTAQKPPTTAIKAAGFTTGSGALGSHVAVPVTNQYERKEETKEEKAHKMEKMILNLVEDSCLAYEQRDTKLALVKAEEAMTHEKNLWRFYEEQHIGETDATISGLVILQYANVSKECGMNTEAISQYDLILKNKLLPLHHRLRVNIGNIYVHSKQYNKALKMYRMALDQIPEQNLNLKTQIRQNIASTHILMGQYTEAAQVYEELMQERPTYRCGLNLILCHYAFGQNEKMRQAFTDILKVPFPNSDGDYQTGISDNHGSLVLEAMRDDPLKQLDRKRRRTAENTIITAAKLIANCFDGGFANGYEWCIEKVRNSEYFELASGLVIHKAIALLRDDNFLKAISTLKEFEKAETKLASAAATNLSFLHFLEKDFSSAHKYADLALKADKFNPASLTNKGNCCFAEGDYDKARYYYEEALNKDAGSIQALHNLILTLMNTKHYQRVKDLLHKYTIMQPGNAQVFCLMGQVLQETDHIEQAKSWYLQALSTHRTDGCLQRRIGEMIDNQGDKVDAVQYYFDAFRHNPCDLATLEWLTSYYLDAQYPEKAVEFCAQAALIRPGDIKWHLMVASCYRRCGNYIASVEKYKWIHDHFPDDINCLQFLIKISIDLGLPERESYEMELKKVNKMKEIQNQRKTNADKSRNIVQGRRISHAELEIPINNTKSNVDSPRKRTPIDLENTEGVFSQQEPIIVHSYVAQLPQQDRPKTSISKRPNKSTVFDDKDDVAELLPD